jgi:hypothetical protein
MRRERDHRALLARGRESKTRLNIFRRKVWKIVQHFGDAHAAAQITEQIADSDARAFDARLAAVEANTSSNF